MLIYIIMIVVLFIYIIMDIIIIQSRLLVEVEEVKMLGLRVHSKLDWIEDLRLKLVNVEENWHWLSRSRKKLTLTCKKPLLWTLHWLFDYKFTTKILSLASSKTTSTPTKGLTIKKSWCQTKHLESNLILMYFYRFLFIIISYDGPMYANWYNNNVLMM